MEETKAIYMREKTLKEAKKETAEHLRGHGSAYVSEIAEELGIDVELTLKAVETKTPSPIFSSTN